MTKHKQSGTFITCGECGKGTTLDIVVNSQDQPSFPGLGDKPTHQLRSNLVKVGDKGYAHAKGDFCATVKRIESRAQKDSAKLHGLALPPDKGVHATKSNQPVTPSGIILP